MEFTFFTYNIDFNRTNLKEKTSLDSVKEKADVLCVQEAKHLDVGRVLGNKFFCHQNLSDQAKQGVALAWRRGKVHRLFNVPGKRPRIQHRGYLVGVLGRGLKLLPRYINWRDLEFDGTVVRVISTHRPPQRFKWLWNLFDRVLAAFVKRSPYPVIIGMDSNEADHRGFEKQTGMVWHGVGIDGFYLTPWLNKHVVKGSLKAHPKAKSDHHPVSLVLDI